LNKAGILACISSPSGGGKTTVCRRLVAHREEYRFSISCTTRPPRGEETDGVDYYFLSREAFRQKIQAGDLAEYQEVHGHYYGTLKAAIQEALHQGQVLLADIDVKGALNLKQHYGERCLTIFLKPPSLEVLKQRLRDRGTESEERRQARMERLELEMSYGKKFDRVITNNRLDETVGQVEHIIEQKREVITEEFIHGSGNNTLFRT